jgi:hypothetical protein
MNGAGTRGVSATPSRPARASRPGLAIPARLVVLAALVAGTLFASVDPFSTFFFLCYAAVGALLVFRRPGQVIGWLLVALAFGFIGTTSQPGVDVPALLRGDATVRDILVVWIGAWSGYATFTGFVLLMFLFPSGRIANTRAALLATVLVGIGVAAVLLSALAPVLPYDAVGDGVTPAVLIPNPFAVAPSWPVWRAIPLDQLITPVLGCLLIGTAAMLRRFRHAVGLERLQMRWLVASVGAMVATVTTGLVLLAVVEGIGGAAWIPAIVAYPTIPIAIGVAILRYRLYEIDRIISRTIGWAIVTGVLVVVFAGGVIVLQAALAPFTRENTLAVAASTLLAFALFQPLRRLVQRAVDNRFDRARPDGERVALAFADRLRGQVDLLGLEQDVERTVDAALRPSASALWVRTIRGGDTPQVP